jgi:hypothetical protein
MGLSRRDIVKGAAATVPASVALQMLGTRFAFAQSGDFENDVDVLNYALTLEYLESEFYRQGNGAGLLSGKEATYLQQVGADEDAHVAAIMQTIMQLGGMPVEAPGVDFGQAFASRESFLETAFTFENLGVSAYLGAAGFIQDPTILQAAAGIFGVEARHAAIIGNLAGKPAEGGVYMGATETPLPPSEVLAAAQPFLTGAAAMAGGAAVTRCPVPRRPVRRHRGGRGVVQSGQLRRRRALRPPGLRRTTRSTRPMTIPAALAAPR